MARNHIQNGEYVEAELDLQTKIETAQGDKLAYLLEYAIVLHQANKYKESNETLAEADDLAEKNDYYSVSREAGAALINEGLTQFKPETYEFLLINVYQALNYMMLGDYENAQVMARKINEKLTKLEVDGDSRKRQNAFAYYLAAMMWESQNDPDNALILYTKAQDLMPELEILRRNWLMCAQRAQRRDVVKKITKKYPYLKDEVNWRKVRKKAELIVIFQQGWAPRKHKRPENYSIPMVLPTRSEFSGARVVVDNGGELLTEKVYDLDIIAKQTLDAEMGKLVARYAARVAARTTLGHQMNKENDGLGSLVQLALKVADQADLRHWSMLPSSFQILRLYVPAGKHQVKVMAVGGSANRILVDEEVELKSGAKTFITTRAF